jgi:hypothetical protein
MNELLKQEVLKYVKSLYESFELPKNENEQEEDYKARVATFKGNLERAIQTSLDDYSQGMEQQVLIFEYDNELGAEVGESFVPAGLCKEPGKYVGILLSSSSFKTVFCDQVFTEQKAAELEQKYSLEMVRSSMVKHALEKVQNFLNSYLKDEAI